MVTAAARAAAQATSTCSHGLPSVPFRLAVPSFLCFLTTATMFTGPCTPNVTADLLAAGLLAAIVDLLVLWPEGLCRQAPTLPAGTQ